MRPEDVPQAAVDAAAVEVGRALSPFYGRPTAEDALITRRVVAAAAPHLIDDAMIERAARAVWDECWSGGTCDSWEEMVAKGDEPAIVQSVRADAACILRAALGEVDGDGR